MKDIFREQWIRENLPDDKTFGPEAVKILMRLAYDEGKRHQQNIQKEEDRERQYGPDFI